jgi:hypothetical protein
VGHRGKDRLSSAARHVKVHQPAERVLCVPQPATHMRSIPTPASGAANPLATDVSCQRFVCMGRMAATWLILPVVICLSQGLSHACLSINCFIL